MATLGSRSWEPGPASLQGALTSGEGRVGGRAAQALTSRQQAEAGSPGSSWSFQNGTAVAQGEAASVKGELRLTR